MKQTKLIMGMPITVEIVDSQATKKNLADVFSFFRKVDRQFSPYKKTSEVSQINRQELLEQDYSVEMKEILYLSQKTKKETGGYFDVYHKGYLDPSGLVKGWAILKAAGLLQALGFRNYYVEAGGDIQTAGKNSKGEKWRIGIRNPFDLKQLIKIVRVSGKGVATSGTYLRGDHIYNPYKDAQKVTEIASLTVIGSNIYNADRLATAAFAMGEKGIAYIGSLVGFEGYMIDKDGIATFTSGFERYTV